MAEPVSLCEGTMIAWYLDERVVDNWRFGDLDDWSSVLKSKLKATEQPLQYPLYDCFTPSRCWHFAEILHPKKSLIFLMVDLLGWNHPFDLPNLESRWPWPLHKQLGTRANFHPPGQLLFGLHFLAQRHTEILAIWDLRFQEARNWCTLLQVVACWSVLVTCPKSPLLFPWPKNSSKKHGVLLS